MQFYTMAKQIILITEKLPQALLINKMEKNAY